MSKYQYKKEKSSNKINRYLMLIIFIGIVFVGKQQYDKYILNKRFADVKSALQKVSLNLNKSEIAMIELHKITKILEK